MAKQQLNINVDNLLKSTYQNVFDEMSQTAGKLWTKKVNVITQYAEKTLNAILSDPNPDKNLTKYFNIVSAMGELYRGERINYRIYVNGDNNTAKIYSIPGEEIEKYVKLKESGKAGLDLDMFKNADNNSLNSKRDQVYEALYKKHMSDISKGLLKYKSGTHGEPVDNLGPGNYVVTYDVIESFEKKWLDSRFVKQNSKNKRVHRLTYNYGWISEFFDRTVNALYPESILTQTENTLISPINSSKFFNEYFGNQLYRDNISGFRTGDVGNTQIKSLSKYTTIIKKNQIIRILRAIVNAGKNEIKDKNGKIITRSRILDAVFTELGFKAGVNEVVEQMSQSDVNSLINLLL